MIKQVTMENQKISKEVRTGVTNIGQDIHLIRQAAELFASLMKRLESATQVLRQLRDQHKQNYGQIEMDMDQAITSNTVLNKRDQREVDGGADEGAQNHEKRRAHYEQESERISASLEKAEKEVEDAAALKTKLNNLVDRIQGRMGLLLNL